MQTSHQHRQSKLLLHLSRPGGNFTADWQNSDSCNCRTVPLTFCRQSNDPSLPSATIDDTGKSGLIPCNAIACGRQQRTRLVLSVLAGDEFSNIGGKRYQLALVATEPNLWLSAVRRAPCPGGKLRLIPGPSQQRSHCGKEFSVSRFMCPLHGV